MATTTVAPHECGLCDGPLTFNGVSAEYATWTCPACGWWHIAKDCCEGHPIPAMTPAQQERADAEAALTAAVLAYRADPSPENREANLAAARVYMDASHAVIADEMIEMQGRPAGPSPLCCPDWPILHVHARSCEHGPAGRPR